MNLTLAGAVVAGAARLALKAGGRALSVTHEDPVIAKLRDLPILE